MSKTRSWYLDTVHLILSFIADKVFITCYVFEVDQLANLHSDTLRDLAPQLEYL